MNFTKRCWAEISIDNLLNNLNLIKSVCQAEVMCVVKANAYGHGDLTVVSELQKAGVKYFAVACMDEAVHLRQNGCTGEILVLGGYLDDCFDLALKYDISLAMYDVELAKNLSEYALSNNKKAKIHIKLNTGMTRLGFDIVSDKSFQETLMSIELISKLEGVDICGVFTHYAVSDEQDGAQFTSMQFDLLTLFKQALLAKNINIPLWHASNSGAIINYSKKSLDMVRAGIVLYGIYDCFGVSANYKPVLSLKTVITQIRNVSEKASVSYGRTFKCVRGQKLATLSIGYADGLPRSLSNEGKVIVNGKLANIVGRVCMDQIVVDVTEIDCKVGDFVTVIGEQNGVQISVGDIAKIDGTINYEILCNFSTRIPRVYIKDNEVISITKYI